MDIMFVYGIPDDQRGQILVNAQGGISIQFGGSANVRQFLRKLPGKARVFHVQSSRREQAFNLDYWPRVIFNEISDPDSHEISLGRCEVFCRQQGVPVINHPQAIRQTRRDLISQHLHDMPGLIMPRTVRFNPRSPADVRQAIAAEGLPYPVIFRQAGDHGGISTVLLENPDAIDTAMYPFALDGRAYYLTEFRDFAAADGLYRKYRIVVVEGEPYLRHMIVSDHWLIHSVSREYMKAHPHCQEEEARVLASFDTELAPWLRPLTQALAGRLQLEYFGIDCHITPDRQLLVFEINANMNILSNNQPLPNIWQGSIDTIIARLERLVARKAGA